MSNLPCAFWDMLPTLCHMAGAPVDPATAGLDGVSLVPEMLGSPDQQQKHDYLYWELPEKGGRQALRQGPWKAVRYNVSEDPAAPVELYNLDDDIGEETDLSGKFPDRTREMRDFLNSVRTESRDFPLFS